MNNGNKILAAAAIGVVAGAALGILFAPDKGSETRKKISDDIKNRVNKSKEKLNDFKEDIAQSVKEKIEEFA